MNGLVRKFVGMVGVKSAVTFLMTSGISLSVKKGESKDNSESQKDKKENTNNKDNIIYEI